MPVFVEEYKGWRIWSYSDKYVAHDEYKGNLCHEDLEELKKLCLITKPRRFTSRCYEHEDKIQKMGFDV